ncbi:hypothetical protein VTJ04DRAFT_10344 [Mycothermus thermophilus]|uniref:uncharacterized protein n=1 Tax=Humicola insolens TaxID=85995 RepID=UPI003743DD83
MLSNCWTEGIHPSPTPLVRCSILIIVVRAVLITREWVVARVLLLVIALYLPVPVPIHELRESLFDLVLGDNPTLGVVGYRQVAEVRSE